MAFGQTQKRYPFIGKPVGGKAEVAALDERLIETVATCSKRIKGENMGCHCWARDVGQSCEFAFKGDRPQYVACRINDDIEGTTTIAVLHCQDAVLVKDSTELNGGYVEFLGGEGTQVEMQGSRRKHPTVDPTCPECIKGNCLAHESQAFIHTVPAFPAAADHKLLKMFAKRQMLRDIHKNEAERANQKRVYGNVPEPGKEPEPDEQEAEPAGGGTRHRGQRVGRKNSPTAAEAE